MTKYAAPLDSRKSLLYDWYSDSVSLSQWI